MQIRVGYELVYQFPQTTPVILILNIHYTRVSEIARPDHIIITPNVPITSYRDTFGNWCNRILAPAGQVRIWSDAVVNDPGAPDVVAPWAEQCAIQALPEDALMFLLGSRYCETDRLLERAWSLFAESPTGWGRVQAICDFVHHHVAFGYEHARSTKTACEVFDERKGVCRDFAHLAIALCRCMNIPARYCTGYLGDIGVPPMAAPMDFAAFRGVFGWAVVHVRPTKQRPAHRSRADRERPRRGGRRDYDYLRSQHAGELPRLDR
jgi:transglutaminase-like putative cysteine protease